MNDLYKYYLPNEEYIEQYADKGMQAAAAFSFTKQQH